ncbi:hypothetical protein [Pseudophaeobacter flagellatus]|uniref:hypothetical protein n=1 Tax=Pseudophaeobacter flagellatus TaxID=2899119 RepID=UPI001E3603FF|nr:hypothetical protein [Pseudophaeobacter flagellatus]MCD9149984.1 hypothetical protein [Pseudophaeobacter flagellatus]
MKKLTPLFASEQNSARLLDMPRILFSSLVEAGALPGPCRIMGEERWDVDELAAAMRGKKPAGNEDLEL